MRFLYMATLMFLALSQVLIAEDRSELNLPEGVSTRDVRASVIQNNGIEDIQYIFTDKEVWGFSKKTHSWFSAGTSYIGTVTEGTRIGTHGIAFSAGNGTLSVYNTVTHQWRFNVDENQPDPVAFHLVDYVILVFYLLGMTFLGFFFRKDAQTSNGFFRGDGRIPWWAAGISIFATTLSTITFMAIPAKTYVSNWLYFPMAFSILLVAPVIIKWYLPFFRRLNVTSAYEFLEIRFGLGVRLLSSTFFILFMITRIAIVLYLPSLALCTVTGMNLLFCILVTSIVTLTYSTLGGVKAVIWGDVIQGFVLVGGALIAALYMVVNSGGVVETVSLANSAQKFKFLDFSMSLSQPTFWVMFFGAGLANSLITYSSDQTVIQRYLTTESEQKAARSIWLNGLISLPVLVLFYFIGSALFTFYTVHPERMPVTSPNSEGVFPYFIANELPVGMSGLLIAAVFAATMSTLSSNINSAATAFTCDWLKRFSPDLKDSSEVRWAKISGVMICTLGTWLAIILSEMSVKSFFDTFNAFIGLLTSGLGGLFFIGVFLPRVKGFSAFCGLVGSILILLCMQYGGCTVNPMMYGLVGMVLSVFIALGMSVFER